MSEEQTVAEQEEQEVQTEEQQQSEETAQEAKEEDSESSDDADKEEKEEKKDDKPKRNLSREKEIARRTWEMHEERRALEAERKRFEEAKQAANDIKKPNIDDYDDHDKFEEELNNYYKKRAEIDAEEKARALDEANRQKQSSAKINQKWELAKEQELEDNPDFDANEIRVGRVLSLYNASHVAQAIVESDDGVKLVNYLAKNLDVAEEIAQKPQMAGLIELGKVASKLNKKPEKKPSQAPAPVSRDKSGGSANKNISTMTQAEYNKWRNSQ
jgi:hypothetical protein